MVAVEKILVGQPVARVDQRHLPIPAHGLDPIVYASGHLGGIHGLKFRAFGHEHERHMDAVTSTQVQ